MGLTDVGVSFKAENYNNFLASIGKASESVSLFGNVTGNTAFKLYQFSKQMEKNTKVAKTFINVGKDFGKIATPILEAAAAAKESDSIFKKFGGTIADTVLQAAKLGGTIGGMVGAIASSIPAVMGAILTTPLGGLGGPAIEAIGTMAGAIIGAGGAAYFAIAKAFVQLGADIISSIGGFFGKIGSAVLKFMGTAIQAFYQAGVSIAKAIVNMVEKIYNGLKSIVNKVIDLIKGLFKSLFGMFSGEGAIAGRGGWRGLGSSIFSAMFKFEVLKQVIRSVINEVKQFSQAAFQAAVDLQTMTIRLDNLIAAQIRSAKLTDDYATSIRMAGKYTQGLLQWSQKLALSTPVSLEDITRTVSLSIAMGWTVEAAKTMTKSIIDYTSATGLGSEVTERIIYNFAQMKQQGKVTGTELRDLGRGAFMPVNDILEIMYKDMGDVNMSFEEFKQQASEGKVAVEGFFDAFNEYVAKNMPDAAYRMNYTFAAVMNNMRDLFNILLGWNVLDPMIASITKPLQGLIDKLSSPTILANLNAIGKALAFLMDSIRGAVGEVFGQLGRAFSAMGLGVPTIENVVKSIIKLGLLIQWVGQQIGQFIYHIVRPFAKEVGDKIGGTFDGLNKDAFGWGFGLISNFVQGMIRAALSLLIKAITFISNLIRSWFKISSPPKIAPKIDEWGRGTINEWIDGMTDGNFDNIGKIGDKVNEQLSGKTIIVDPNSMAPALNPNQTNVPGKITYSPKVDDNSKDLAKDLTKNVKGAVTIALPFISREGLRLASEFMHGFSQADFDILDEMQGSLNDVLSALVNLGAISQDQSAKMYVNISQKMIQGLDEFNRTGKISIDMFSELRRIGGVFGQEIQELVQYEIEYAMAIERVNAAQKAYDDAVKASARAQVKVNKLIKGYNDALRKGAKKSYLKENLKLVNAAEVEYAISKKNEVIKEQELEIAKEQQKVAEEQVKLQRSLIENLVELTQKQTDAAGALGEEMGELGDDINALLAGLGDPEAWKGLDFEQLMKDAKEEFNIQLQAIKDDWNDFISENFGETSPIKTALGNIWDTLTTVWTTKISPVLRGLWDDFASYVHLPTWDEILSAWEEPPNYKAPPPGVAISGPTGTDVSRIEKPSLATRFQAVLEKFKEDLKGRGILDILKPIGQWILDKIVEGFQAATAPTGFLNDILDKLFGKEAGLTEQEGKKGSKEFVENVGFGERLFNIIWEQMQLGWQKYYPQISGFMKGVGNVLIESLLNAMNDYMNRKVLEFMVLVFGPNSIFVKSFLNQLEMKSPSKVFERYGNDIIQGLFNGIGNWITTKYNEVKQYFTDFIDDVEDLLGVGKENSDTNPFYLAGKAIINAIVNGINFLKSKISTVVNEIVSSIWNLFPDWLKKWINGTLPKSEGETGGSPKTYTDKGERDVGGQPIGGVAKGGFTKAWQTYWVGEKGPELFIPKMDGFVLPNNITNALLSLASVPAPVAALPVSGNTTITFGDTYINNDMDWAIFKSRVQRAMTEK